MIIALLILPRCAGRPALSALQLQPVLTGRAIQAGDAALAGVQAGDANRSRGLHDRVIRVIALRDATFALKKQRIWAGYAVVLRGTGAGLAGRMAGMALAVLVILIGVAVAATHGRAHTLLVQAPAVDATGAAQRGAGRAAGRTRHALAPLLVRAVTRRTRGATRACNVSSGGNPCVTPRKNFHVQSNSVFLFNLIKFCRKKESFL